jgi:phosphoribosylformylglycinamidine cyclo-ligase
MAAPKSAYAQAGVDQLVADDAVSAIVKVLGSAHLARQSRQVPLPGHFAAVIRITDDLGIAMSTDGVGTKLLIAEQLGRFNTIGIDCVAMNVNDVICVGAEPLAMLDYIAIDRATPEICGQIAVGLARGAELAEIEIPGGELAQLGDIVRGFDIAGACFGLVKLDQIITGENIQPGDVILGLPSSGLHANGYTLARRALEGLPLDSDPEGRLGKSLGDALLEPTEIYVKPVMELLRSPVGVRGLAHITSQGFDNLIRLDADVTYIIDEALEPPPLFNLIQERHRVDDKEMHEVFNMGCGFCCVVAPEDEAATLGMLRAHYPTARRIGRVTEGPRRVERSSAA